MNSKKINAIVDTVLNDILTYGLLFGLVVIAVTVGTMDVARANKVAEKYDVGCKYQRGSYAAQLSNCAGDYHVNKTTRLIIDQDGERKYYKVQN